MLPNICSTKKKNCFDCLIPYTVILWYFPRRLSYRENLIPLQPYVQEHLANPNRGCLHKAVLKVQEKKVRERELNGQTWHIKIMKSWKGNQWKGTRSSKYIFIFGGTFPLYFHLFWLVFMLVCHLRCRKPRKRQRSWNEQVLSGNRVSVHAFVFPNPSHTPPVRNISLPIPKNILGHYSYSPSTGFSLSSRTFNPADYTVSAEAGEAGNETTEGAGECCLLIRNLISLIEQNLLL